MSSVTMSRDNRTSVRSGWKVVLILIIAATLLRFAGIHARSLWGDEIVCLAVATGHSWYPWMGAETELFYDATYYREQLSLAPSYFSQRLVSLLRINDQMPPFYYVVVNLWLHVFGTTEAAVRSLSVLASVASIPVLYALGVQIASRRAAALAALIFAVAPFQVAFALYNRPYALLGFLALLSTLAAVHLSRGNMRMKWLLLHASTVMLGVYTHYLFIWNVVFQIGLVVFYQRHNGRFLRRFALAQLAVAAGCLAWAPIFLAQTRWSREVGINSWFYWYSGSPSLAGTAASLGDTLVKLLSPGRVTGVCGERSGGCALRTALTAISYIVPLLIFGLAAWRLVVHVTRGRRSDHAPDPWMFCILWTGCVLLGPVLMDTFLNSHTVYSHRYFIAASGPVYLAVAMGVAGIQRAALRWSIGAVLASFLVAGTVLHLQGASVTLLYEVDARGVARHIDERSRGGDDLILVMDPGFNPQDFAYYLRSNPDFARVETPEHRASVPDIPSQLQAVISAKERDTVWFFDDRGPDRGARAAVLHWLRTHYDEVGAREFGNLGLVEFSSRRTLAGAFSSVRGSPSPCSGGSC
jgi:uncharacterized membrane protein